MNFESSKSIVRSQRSERIPRYGQGCRRGGSCPPCGRSSNERLIEHQQPVVHEEALLAELSHLCAQLAVPTFKLFAPRESGLPFPALLLVLSLRQTVPTADEVVLFEGLDLLPLGRELELQRLYVPLQISSIFLVPVALIPEPHDLVAEGREDLLEVGTAVASTLQALHQRLDVFVHVARKLHDPRLGSSRHSRPLWLQLMCGKLVEMAVRGHWRRSLAVDLCLNVKA